METEPVTEWLPNLLKEKWGLAADQLLSEGKDLPIKVAPPYIVGAKDRQSGGDIRGGGRIKVYRSGEQSTVPVSWGDTDRDVTTTYTIHYEVKGDNASDWCESVERVIDRILALHRHNPHADWHRIESWSASNPVTYSDFQRLVFTVRLARRGEVLPTPAVDNP